MSAVGFTPIQLYHSTTNGATPLAANLATGELAVNVYNGKLYYKNSNTGAVSILADGATATGNLPGGATGSIVYQSATGVTAYLPIGGAGALLYSNGTLPAYVSLGSAGAILYSNGTAPAYTALGSAGSLLYSNGTAPVYASIGAAGSIVYSTGTAPTSLAIGATDYVLTSTGSAPQFVSQASLSVGSAATAGFATTAGSATSATTATTSTNLAGGAANRVAYQTGASTTSFITAPTVVGTVLGWTGSVFDWVSAPAATTTANIAGGAQYQIPFQSGVSSTTFNSNLTFNSATNTVGTTNITATGAVGANSVLSTTSVGAGTTVVAGTSITAGTSISAGSSLSAVTSITGANVIANGSISASSNTGAYTYGTLSYPDVNILGSYAASQNSYVQNVIQNKNNGSSASVDYIVSNDIGTATTYYGDFGMNSSTYTGIGPFQLPSAVYLYSTDSDLVIGTKTAHALRLVTNDNSADSVTINATGAVAFNGNFGVANQILTSTGNVTPPVWSTPSAIVIGTATNLAGGVAGAVPYQTAPSTTGFTGAGMAGQYLQSNGTSAPTWVTLSVADNSLLWYFMG
jgi:hypothetical protein